MPNVFDNKKGTEHTEAGGLELPISYGRQSIGDKEIQAVTEVLRSPWLTQGPKIIEFEQKIAEVCNARHSVVVSNGTAALHMACDALGVQKGDRVWTSPISFVASANCARYCDATIDFVDIDPVTRNMCLTSLEEKLTHAAKNNTLPKVIIPVHFSGNPCNMVALAQLVKPYGIFVIEDAAHALGSCYQDYRVGCGQHSDIAVFSFHPVKTITTGEGGAAVTNSEALAEKMRVFRTHGISKDPKYFTGEVFGLESCGYDPWYYEQHSLGMNYRMCDLQAALGCVQIGRLAGFIEQRRLRVARYNEALTSLPLSLPHENEQDRASWHLYVIEVENPKTRRYIFEQLVAKKILVNVHYIPIHLQPYYQALGFSKGDFPHSEAYYARAISLPLFPTMTDQQQQYVIETLHEIIAEVGLQEKGNV